ncbi:MAG TPA: hypothetical protein VHC67_16335 [Gaiellaceae bacterium]|nr:hypothetical protein [Gaiellaceae bacterium]
MNSVLSNPAGAAILVAAACYLMVAAGLAKRRLAHRDRLCEVCHRPVSRCTCRWL